MTVFEIYWDNLFMYVFWVLYAGLIFVLWKYDRELYFGVWEKVMQDDEEDEDLS